MIRIEFAGPIELQDIEIEAHSLDEVAEYLKTLPEMSEWLDISAVAVNGKIVTSRDYSLSDGDTVVILPPVCGG